VRPGTYFEPKRDLDITIEYLHETGRGVAYTSRRSRDSSDASAEPHAGCSLRAHNNDDGRSTDPLGIGTFDRANPPRTSPCRRVGKDGLPMSVGDGADHGSWVLGSSVQLEHEAQGFVDRFEFVVAEPSNEFAKSLVRYR
jgi:hypothetical protein